MEIFNGYIHNCSTNLCMKNWLFKEETKFDRFYAIVRDVIIRNDKLIYKILNKFIIRNLFSI